MKGSVFLTMVGLAGAVALIGQIQARAYPGDYLSRFELNPSTTINDS